MNSIFIGYGISLGIGTLVIFFAMYVVFDKWDPNQRENLWYAAWTGIIERFIYTSAVLIDQFGIINGWLILKAVGDWSSSPRQKHRSWPAFTAYLTGNALSIIFGVVGGHYICHFAKECQPLLRQLLA